MHTIIKLIFHGGTAQSARFTNVAVVGLLLAVYPFSADAADAMAMLANFQKSFPALWKLTTAAAYVIGFVFMFRSILGFKHFGEGKGMHHGQGVKGPVILFFVGAILIFTPSVVNTLMLSTFGYSNPMGAPQTGGDWSKYWPVLALIQLIGVISFIRGWVMIVTSSQQGGHASMGKAITHIVGGLLALNIGGTVDILRQTFLGTG